MKMENEKEEELVVREYKIKYKVYVGDQNNSENSDLLNTFTSDCFLSSLSSETIDAFILIANARKSISFGCSEINDSALGILSEYFEKGTNLTTFTRFCLNSSYSSEDNFAFLNISDLCLSSSLIENSGEYKSCPANDNFLIKDPLQKNVYNWLVSRTSFIYNIPLFLSSFNLSCLANSPSLIASSSVNSLFLDNSSSLFNAFCFSNSDSIAFSRILASAKLENSDILSSNSSDTFKQICAIIENDNLDLNNFRLGNTEKRLDDFKLQKISDSGDTIFNGSIDVNQSKNATTGLDYATYTYFASAKNSSGSENKTEVRSIEIANSPSGKKFIITNKSGDNINNSGYMFMLGTYTESSDLSGMTSSNLEIRNSTNNLVAFFDNLGNLKLRGNLAENYGAP